MLARKSSIEEEEKRRKQEIEAQSRNASLRGARGASAPRLRPMQPTPKVRASGGDPTQSEQTAQGSAGYSSCGAADEDAQEEQQRTRLQGLSLDDEAPNRKEETVVQMIDRLRRSGSADEEIAVDVEIECSYYAERRLR